MKKSKNIPHNSMNKVKNKGTDIEILLRKELWARGLRYRKNVKSVYGTPDIAFIGKKVAIFCDSEFWHGYNWDVQKDDFHSNREFWIPKIEANIQRDTEVTFILREQGWIVLRFWGREIKKNCESCVDQIEAALNSRK